MVMVVPSANKLLQSVSKKVHQASQRVFYVYHVNDETCSVDVRIFFFFQICGFEDNSFE